LTVSVLAEADVSAEGLEWVVLRVRLLQHLDRLALLTQTLGRYIPPPFQLQACVLQHLTGKAAVQSFVFQA